MLLYSCLPFLIMIFSSGLIIKRLLTITKKRRKTKSDIRQTKKELDEINLVNIETVATTKENNDLLKTELNVENSKQIQCSLKQEKNNELSRRLRNYNQIYYLLLTMNFTFFVLLSPLVLIATANPGLLNKNETIRDIIYILAYLNHCLNSFAYSMNCEIYRKNLRKVLCLEDTKKKLSLVNSAQSSNKW